MTSGTQVGPEAPAARRPGLTPAAKVGVAVTAIWVAVGLMAVFAPDMIAGSQHEHLPLASITVWVWAAIASGFVAMCGRDTSSGLVIGAAGIWLVAAAAAVWAPVMVTGTDPTRIPLAAILAPLLAAFATGFLALHDVRSRAVPV